MDPLIGDRKISALLKENTILRMKGLITRKTMKKHPPDTTSPFLGVAIESLILKAKLILNLNIKREDHPPLKEKEKRKIKS